MSKPKILSGYDLVAKGFTKNEATLPEVGLKDVQPNGSWLEQKQIQSALEARKHLIEIERIEKSGVLSIAVWKDDLKLAEVTQQVGGYWQYLGHNVGNTLYLQPEEALYLLEVKCLKLIHNDIKVSLQQAYSLLLNGRVTLLQYKVYASLSRLGYRLLRHEKIKVTDYEKKIKLPLSHNKDDIQKENKIDSEEMICKEQEDYNEGCISLQQDVVMNTPSVSGNVNVTADMDILNKNESLTDVRKHRSAHSYQRNVDKLKNRKIRPCNNKIVHKCFDNIPSLLGKQVVTLKIPDRQYVPKEINKENTVYNINLMNVQKKIPSPPTSDSNIYSQTEEANGSHIRRLRNSSANSQSIYSMPLSAMPFPTQNVQFRFFNYWRPPQTFNLLFQRPHLLRRPGPQFGPHLGAHIRLFFNNQPFVRNRFTNNYNVNQVNSNINNRNQRKRCNTREHHLDAIKRLASRLKQLFVTGNTNNDNIQSLHRLIHTYNIRYKTRIRLTNSFDIESEENIVDTITLEDDDEPQTKRHKRQVRTELSERSERTERHYDERLEQSLNLLKHLAIQLKEIENKGQATSKHRRAFTKALKTLNDTYNVAYYVNNEFAVLNSRHVTVASTSDSDCCIEKIQTQSYSGKKLKNPFSIMKRLSETQNNSVPEVSCTNKSTEIMVERDKKYSKLILDTFPTNWLPPEGDFGRAEVVNNLDTDILTDSKHEEFLYDFFAIQQNKFNNWPDLKLSFFKSLEKAVMEFQSISSNSKHHSKSEDDMTKMIDKLKVIKTASAIKQKSDLIIDFDVYNRNVQNFKKSKPPPPHFRIICLSELAPVPCGEEIAALNAEYDDDISIVFAIVGVGSVSYVRMNPTDLPMYIPSNTKI